VFGFQSWIALPVAHEETQPGFQHLAAESLPQTDGDGATVRLLAGSLHGLRSPTRAFSDLFDADVSLIDGARFQVSAEHIERAAYVVGGQVEIEGQTGSFTKDQLIVFKPGAEIVLKASGAARLMILGGEPLPEKRHIFWNFVSSSRERIEQASRDWRKRQFPGVPGETEFIPLPDASVFRAS
jgi:redox-sensitive bicupin YhaK (pirin superfamily)